MKKVTRYESDDGEIFDTPEEAKRHELALLLLVAMPGVHDVDDDKYYIDDAYSVLITLMQQGWTFTPPPGVAAP